MNKYGHIKNPLTVVGIFAGIVEVSGTIVVPFILPANQAIYMWFLMIFPSLLVAIFFLTLNFNHTVLYAPSDFRDDQAFLDALKGIVSKETEPQQLEREDSLVQEINSDVKKVIKAFGGKYTWRTIRGISKEQSLSTDVVLESLNWLSLMNLAVKSVDKERWALTPEGRRLIENIY
jgi:hypothetical protein